MTAKVPLPTEAQVRAAVVQMSADVALSGKRPSVVGLAERLGLTNATFWRHFPVIARDVAARRRATSQPGQLGVPEEQRRDPRSEEARLRRENRTLTEQLELAIANIQRLTLENYRLQREVEAGANVTRLPSRKPNEPGASGDGDA